MGRRENVSKRNPRGFSIPKLTTELHGSKRKTPEELRRPMHACKSDSGGHCALSPEECQAVNGRH